MYILIILYNVCVFSLHSGCVVMCLYCMSFLIYVIIFRPCGFQKSFLSQNAGEYRNKQTVQPLYKVSIYTAPHFHPLCSTPPYCLLPMRLCRVAASLVYSPAVSIYQRMFCLCCAVSRQKHTSLIFFFNFIRKKDSYQQFMVLF